MQEYVVINKTDILSRIDKITADMKNMVRYTKSLYEIHGNSNKYYAFKEGFSRSFSAFVNEKRALERVLSESKPLTEHIGQ